MLDVARDSVPAPDALRTEGDPTHAPRAPQGFAGPAPTQNLVYAVTVALAEDAIEADGRRIPLAPGMTVTAEIRTGSRRILEYVLSPLMEIRDEALGER